MEKILATGTTGILKKLTYVVSEQIGLGWGVKDDLKKLQGTLDMLLAVIADAEKKQEKDEVLRLWLIRLKGVAYDTDDVMDEFAYESMHRCERGDRLKHKVVNFVSSSNPLSFRFKMARKIKNINRSLDEITRDMGRFQLQVTAPIPDGESSEQLNRRDTSHVNESEIIGREYDESKLIKLLTIDTTSSSSSYANPIHYPEKVSVISIVGMGGLGKTTLAQLVYKDELVKKVFELTIWVHVSENFNIETLLVKIMESITQTKFDKVSNFHVLLNIVQEKLNGKKYLLVLDDMWNEDPEQWQSLTSVLLVGAPGSKILITTRNDQVVSVVRGSIPPYYLSQLEDDACWSIIKQKAFSPGGALIAPKMSDIGKEIAKRCYGLPLAAKFLGSLMHFKNKESDWVSIRNDDIWNTPESKRRILPVLKLSYNYLPAHLKQCFSYCSIFPKDWEISKETLVHLWMAEGFLKQSDVKSKKPSEDLGRDYFESLAWSSFFHNFKKNELGDIQSCKMHDLVHDLAKDVTGEKELVSLRVSRFTDVSEVRRLCLDLDEEISPAFLHSLSTAKKLRSLFIPEGSNLDPSIFSLNHHLRILHVGRSPNCAPPKWRTLSVLKHLRYLHLTTLILREVENDGQFINKLHNLETLVLTCMGIHVQVLLTNIQSLKKLRYLEASWTNMEKLPDSVTSLCNLQTLDLNNCKLIVIPDSICGLESLRFLNLSFNPIEELPFSITTLSNLETLDVNNCKNLKSLPDYVAGLSNLRIFDFKNCPLLEELPEDIGALTRLRSLDLTGTEIKVLPKSFANLSDVECLHLFHCQLPKDVKNLVKLRKFTFNYRRNPVVSGVGKLVFLQDLLYSVPEKQINEAEVNVGVEELGNLNFLKRLDIVNVQNVKDPMDAERANLKGKQNLHDLGLYWEETRDEKSCSNFQVFEAFQPPTSLRYLTIRNFMGWDLPTWMCAPSGLPELEYLEVRKIKQLPACIGQLSRLRYLKLEGLSLKSLDIDGFPSLMYLGLTDMFFLEELGYSYPCLGDLRISGCMSLTEIPSFPSLKTLVLQKIRETLIYSVGRSQPSLTSLYLENIEELIYFPISVFQGNCNLQLLQIEECNRFQGFRFYKDDFFFQISLPYSCHVQKLKLFHCPVLKFLPDLRRWTSLQLLTIFNCPQVKESLTYDLKSLSSLTELYVDFIQRDDQHGDPSTSDDLLNLLGARC